ncbi:MAG: hypothetical protein C0467_24295 [Planctomycetaceae bacterium]|nr:hypothetical protein [Planctomycetaceae bacterium]
MSFENRFVVDLFVKLSPFIDRAADNHVLTDQPQHEESIPDLCIKLHGVRDALRIEVKWIKQPRATNVTLTKKQIRSWQSPPAANNRTPHLWVARRAKEGHYFLVRHSDMKGILKSAFQQIGPKVIDEDRYWNIALPGQGLTEPEFWREFWTFVATQPSE